MTEQLALHFEAAPLLVDQAARDHAATCVDEPVVVAAGAGAGKTETLIRRLATALDRPGAAPERVVAITFTDRAARDLVHKLRTRLPEHLVHHVEHLRVGTIHSFCLGILRRHPLEAGLPPVFTTQDELLQGADAAERIGRIRDQFFDEVAALDDPALRQAVDLFVATYSLETLHALVALVDQQWDRFAAAAFDVPAPWHDACREIAARLRSIAAEAPADSKLPDLLARICAGADAVTAAPDMVAAMAQVPLVDLRTNGGGAWKERRAEVKSLVTGMQAAVYECALGHLLHVLVPIVLREAEARYRRGQLSFDDILVLTRRLLAERADVRHRVRGEIDHLCVDEFQDTDVVQYDIVRALTDPWDGPDGAPSHRPVLFAVGDAKQSIYGFRDADVALFEHLRATPGITALELSTNFRSRPAIIRWVNEVFAPWFAGGAADGQVPFAPLDHHVADAPSTVAVIGGPVDASAEEVSRRQARDIARTVQHACGSWRVRSDEGERPATAGDIAVLVRQRSDLVHLEPALRRAGIPYVVEGGALLYDTREVRDLLRVLRAVQDTASPAKVVTALRTSVLAISDVELVEHRRAGGSWWLPWDDGPHERNGHPAVLDALGRLGRWSRARHHTPVPELLRRVADETLSVAAAVVDGAATTTWRRLRLVLDEARWWYEQTGGSLGEYLAWVDLRVDEQDRTNVTSDETDEDAVHILTIHAAKGLEYPIVVVAGLGRQGGGGELVRAALEPDGAGGVRALVKMGRFAHRDAIARFAADDAVAKLEAARLAYVACTRARDHLVVCAHHRAASTARELCRHVPDARPLELPPVRSVDRPGVVELDERDDRAPARGAHWRFRSSWSPTVVRHSVDDPPPAAPEPEPAPDAAAPTSDGGEQVPEAGTGAAEAGAPPVESRHSKPPRPHLALPDQIGRYGTRVGRAVHGVLQVVDLHDPRRGLEQLVAAQCAAEDVPHHLTSYVAGLVDSVLAGEVLARMSAAARVATVRREMYVGALVDDEGLYGIIDAVWIEDGRFVLVDFKTDHALVAPEVLAARYRAQLVAYARALRAATGLEVGEALLCVARPGGEPAITVPVDVGGG